MPSRFTIRVAPFLLAGLLVQLPASDARAGSNDAEVEELLAAVFATSYSEQDFDAALEQLQFAISACEEGDCSKKTVAKVYIAVGTVLAGGMGSVDEAKAAFVIALKQNPKASLMGDFKSADVEKAFELARKETGAAGGSQKEDDDGDRPPRKIFPGTGPKPAGWKSAEAYFYYQEAVASQEQRIWRDCVGYVGDSLAAENRITTRYLGAQCAERAGLWIEALEDYEQVADQAARIGLYDVGSDAEQRVEQLQQKIPKVVIRPPTGVKDLEVRIDDKKITEAQIGGEVWVNPGERLVTAAGKIGGDEMVFEQLVDMGEFETATVDVTLVPKDSTLRAKDVMRCMAQATTKDEFANCISGAEEASFNIRIGSEISGYHDSDDVDVVSPAINVQVTSPTDGWSFGGGFLVDVVTAASADIVATASPRWTEVRYVPSLNASQKLGDVTVGITGNLSHEPDYLATSAGINFGADLFDKRVTPSLSYEFGYDTSGRSGTEFDVFSETIIRHGFGIGSTFILSKATLLGLTVNLIFEDGDNSKPYRYVPMFSAENAERIPPGFAIESVNAFREPERVLEQLPTDRQRYAVGGLIAHRFESATLRLDQRIYSDSWGVKASTTDGRFIFDVGDRMWIWPHGRFHIQSAADFWELAYTVERTNTGVILPALRTGDRELGPLFSVTGGGGIRYALGAEKSWAVLLNADIVYSRFLDHLFILQRLGYFGALGLEIEID